MQKIQKRVNPTRKPLKSEHRKDLENRHSLFNNQVFFFLESRQGDLIHQIANQKIQMD